MVEQTIAKLLSFSRWLLAPFYFALVVTVAAVKAGQHLFTFLSHVISASETALIVEELKLVDLTLMASLIIIIFFSGYSNFVGPTPSMRDGRGGSGASIFPG
jgi:uncharacterized protein (TIGR00645 family)